MGSNTHEELAIAHGETVKALEAERAGDYSKVLDHISEAQEHLGRAESIMVSIRSRNA